MTCKAIPTEGHPIVLVGHVHGFPAHPDPGTVLGSLMSGYEVRPDDHPPELLYALVTVDWATEYTTVDVDSGESSTEYRRDGSLGVPTGWSFYLAPAVFDEAAGCYRLNNRQLARGHRNAQLPANVVALGVPEVVPIHDFPVFG